MSFLADSFSHGLIHVTHKRRPS